ncbi:MAG: DUF2961 domain-containing protein [Candidatus Hydrogenedentes bacterium]|nr:DUF2961 domain-containing protein [Candidatus Hydrogenedentota bacterium]
MPNSSSFSRTIGLVTCAISCIALPIFCFCLTASAQQPIDVVHQPYLLDTGLVSRSISFENPTGAPGEGGKAAGQWGPGRKGAPSRVLKPGETVQLCDIKGSGTIRHIWMTMRAMPPNIAPNQPAVLRSLVLRAKWDGQQHPSIECPIGDFFGFAHGKVSAYQSAVHSIGPLSGLSFWLPMPFSKQATITISNEHDTEILFYYQIDYTLGDKHPADVGRLHTLFRRENPTTRKQDFELLPQRKGKGRYVGTVIGIRNLHPEQWWGEGEVKMYMDGDTEFPTICGTGSEDYVGLSWGIQVATFLYNGCSLKEKDFVSMYRWHLPDPIVWQKDIRITIQQLGFPGGETESDWSCASFWYEPIPSAPLPAMPNVQARTANIWPDQLPVE